MLDPHAHCGYCGVRFADSSWPRKCGACGRTTFRNPAPVAVVLAPVDDGLLVVQRAIEPARGKWALPGGYIDYGESWQVAAVRELREETGVVSDPERARIEAVHSPPGGRQVLLFVRVAPLSRAQIPPFQESAEVSALDVIDGPRELAFPLHTELCRQFFADRG